MDVVFATGNPALRAMLGTQTMFLVKVDGFRDPESHIVDGSVIDVDTGFWPIPLGPCIVILSQAYITQTINQLSSSEPGAQCNESTGTPNVLGFLMLKIGGGFTTAAALM